VTIVQPEDWYRLFWLAVEVVRVFVLIVLARFFLVDPILRALAELKK